MRSSFGDRELVRRIIAGDTAAAEEFDRRFRPQFELIARSRAVPYPDYQDVAQNALLDGLRQLEGFQWKCSLGSWLELILHGHVVNWLRKLLPSMTEIDAPSVRGDEQGTEIGRIDQLTLEPNQETIIWVRETLQAMSPRHRMFLILNVIGGFTAKEIADRVGLPTGTVGRNITEAKEIFRVKFLGREKSDDTPRHKD